MTYENEGSQEPEEAGASSQNQQAAELLEEIFQSWTDITFDEDTTYHSPANRKQIKKSRVLIYRIKQLDVSDKELLARLEELESIVDAMDKAIPDNSGRMTRSVIFSLLLLAGFVLLYFLNTTRIPVINYDKDWFTSSGQGYLLWNVNTSDVETNEKEPKVLLKAGVQLQPLARIGSKFFVVQTPEGHRGLVSSSLLNGWKYVEAGDDARIFDEIGADKEDTIAPGTKAVVLKREEKKLNNNTVAFIRIKLDDGTVKWGYERYFHRLILDDIPEVDMDYRLSTTIGTARKHILGRSLEEIESHYGMALSYLKVDTMIQAYFSHLYVMDNRRQHKGIFVNFDENDLAQNIGYRNEGQKRFYRIFPLVNWIRSLEPGKVFNYSYFTGNQVHFHWWENFKARNWITKALGWIVKMIFWGIVLFILFLLPWAISSPVNNAIMFNRGISNEAVPFLCTPVYFIVAYLFFLFMIILMDHWFIPAIFTLVAAGIWWTMYLNKIEYDRCPACHTMYSALDKGTSFLGGTSSVSWGTYDIDKGTTVKTVSIGDNKTLTTTTHHIERRDMKTTTTVDKYLDHRQCGRCGYTWDVKRKETKEDSEYY